MASAITRLNKAAKKTFATSEIEDIILFGSAMKGDDEPEDIDVLLVFKEKIDKGVEKAFREAAGIPNLDANSITVAELEGEGFIAKEGVYLEGRSLITGILMSEKLGFFSAALITYDLSKTKGSARTRFYYALQGRGKEKGFLEILGGKRFSDNVVICPYLRSGEMTPFFERWGVPYTVLPALMPMRMKKVVMG